MTIRELLKDLKLSNLNTQIVLKDSIYLSNTKDDIDNDILDKEVGYWYPKVELEEESVSWSICIATKEWCTLTDNKEGYPNDC